MKQFVVGDRIKMKYYDYYATGEITIIRENDCKVLFDGDYDLAYDYYPKDELELIELEEPRTAKGSLD